MNDALRTCAVDDLDLLHQREAEALRDPALDLALDGQRVDRLADVLRRRDLDHAHEPELDVDVDDGAMGGERERHVRVALAVLVERERLRGGGARASTSIGSSPIEVDESSRAARAASSSLTAAQASLHRAAGHPRLARRRRRARGADLRVGRQHHHALDAELVAGDLLLHGDEPLADLGRRGVDLHERLAADHREPDAGGRVVVEALRVADVLVADGVADAAPDALAVRRVRVPTGEHGRGRPAAAAGRATLASSSLDRRGAADRRPGRDHAALGERVAAPQLDRIHLQRRGELVHLRLVREAGLHGAEAAHRAARRVVGVDDVGVDQRVRHVVRPAGERGRVGAHRRRARRVGAAVEHDPAPM